MSEITSEATHKNGLMLFKVKNGQCHLLSHNQSEWIRLSMSYLDLLGWGATEINHTPINWAEIYGENE
jgi:hypothetical protein